MSIHLDPYLNFRDQTRDAMTFYKDVFGGDLTMNTFADFHASEDPAEADKIMHSQLETTDGMVLMAADVPNSMDLPGASATSISLSGDDDPTACASTASASPGWSTSPARRADPTAAAGHASSDACSASPSSVRAAASAGASPSATHASTDAWQGPGAHQHARARPASSCRAASRSAGRYGLANRDRASP